jgi:hypothetical protein
VQRKSKHILNTYQEIYFNAQKIEIGTEIITQSGISQYNILFLKVVVTGLTPLNLNLSTRWR